MATLLHVEHEREREKPTSWQILKIAIAIGLIGLVIFQVNLESLAALRKHISFPWLLVSILAFYASIWSMARRYWVLIGRKIAFHELLKVVLYQTIMGNLVTTSAGAALYVGILHSKYRVQISNGLLSLVLARFGDLLTLLLTLSFAALVVWPQIRRLHLAVVLVISLLLAVVSLVLFLLVFRRQLIVIAGRILDKLRLGEKAFVQWILAMLTTLSNEKIGPFRIAIASFAGYSFLTLGMMLLFAYSSLQIFGVRIDIWPIIFVVSLTQIITLVPVQVFGGLGLYDVSYLYLYGLFGMDRSEFAPVVVGLRLSFYLTNMVLLLLVPITTRLRQDRNR